MTVRVYVLLSRFYGVDTGTDSMEVLLPVPTTEAMDMWRRPFKVLPAGLHNIHSNIRPRQT